MHSKASLALAVGVLLLSGYGLIAAWAWPWKAALFPLVIGVPLFCLAVAEVLWVLLGRPESKAGAMDFQFSTSKGSLRRTAVSIGWMLAFFAAIVLLGFPIAVPLFVLLYVKLQGGEGWVLSIVMTLVVWGIFYGLFDRLLHLPFPAGWLFG